MKILITGATGYVGKHLINELCESRHELFALVREKSNTDELFKRGVKLFIGDVSKRKSFDQINPEFDIIIHLAFSFFPGSNPSINVIGFDNVLSFAQQNPLKRFIYVSSQLVYGNTPENEIIDEQYPCRTSMVFGKQQLRAENKLKSLFAKENFPMVIFRPSEIYGGKGGFFEKVHLDGYINGKIPIIGNGENAISFSFIGDLVQAISNSIEKDGINGNIFNINTPGLLTQNNLIELIKVKKRIKPVHRIPIFLGWIAASLTMLIAKLSGKTPLMDYDTIRVATMKSGERSIDKAIKLLGLKPKYQDVSTGLIDCYFKN